MRKIITYFLIISFVFAMFVGVNAVNAENYNISVSVKTDKQYYKLGDPVHITCTVKNNGNSPVKLTFRNTQMYDLSIVSLGLGKLIYKWSKGKMFAQVITYLTIPANGEKIFDFTWNQKSNTGASVTIGDYRVNFWLALPNGFGKPGINTPYLGYTDFQIVSTVNCHFQDVINPYQQPFVEELYEKGIVKGFPDGTFKPNLKLTRAQAVTLILRLMHVVPSSNYTQHFVDVPPHFWAFKYVEEAYVRGIAKGVGNGKFAPNRPISRGEFTVMLVRALKLPYVNKNNPFVDITPSYFGYKEIITAFYRYISVGVEKNGKRYFLPYSSITRGDAAVEMGRAMDLNKASSFTLLGSIKETPFSANENAVSVSADVPNYSVDFSRIKNVKSFDFSEKQKTFLEQNGFFIKKSDFDSFDRFYQSNGGKPLFISFDTFLQAYHTLFDLTLRYDEVNYFEHYLDQLNRGLIESCGYALLNAPKDLVPAVVRDVEYLYVGEKLLTPDYKLPSFVEQAFSIANSTENLSKEVEEKVNSEISLIDAHKGFAVSPIFGYKEDYSQYVPRGHYTKTEDLKHYFKAMMWFGRMRFLLKPGVTPQLINMGRSQTQSALILSLIIGSSDTFRSLYDKIYEPTVFFVGKSDDLNFYNYLSVAKEVFGQKVLLSELSNAEKIDQFINAALKLPNPKISTAGEADVNKSKGFRLMGQRFTPDSYMLQNLVYPRAGYRMMPKALDVFFVLGNKKAGDILLNTYNEKKNAAYVLEVKALQKEFSAFGLKEWLQNLYWGWLSVLKEYAQGEYGKGYPFFMRNNNWAKKELITALSSYTELKHDTILYAKQSYTTKSAMPILKPGYVEPNIKGFTRLITVLNMTENGLSERGLLPDVLKDKIEFLKSLTENALAISKKELTGESLSKNEMMYLATFPDAVGNLFSFPKDFMATLGGSDEKVPLVADIHTDPNAGEVLEEGVGYVNTIYVVAPFNGNLYIFTGPVFSYYEFTEKMDNRLTDQKWNSMLKNGTVPNMPVWEKDLIP